ncbi:hypothetical protein PAPYR_2229 [Paratrimastix pyriformis]|uniref:Ubiquitin-like domain-containing protein n=1 Tax=Paratrimastix pyriformis TaxID=342808 RepID=A0ABQ8US81_9EUKA|nr:hypothetical protein PAPYR_2229 [Paratrimastix pyriformis]
MASKPQAPPEDDAASVSSYSSESSQSSYSDEEPIPTHQQQRDGGIRLESAIAAPPGERCADRRQEEEELRGADVTVDFTLPDGTHRTQQFKMGHDVQYLKSVLERECGLDFARMRLFLGSRLMPDPLSLNDFPIDIATPVEIRVQIE